MSAAIFFAGEMMIRIVSLRFRLRLRRGLLFYVAFRDEQGRGRAHPSWVSFFIHWYLRKRR